MPTENTEQDAEVEIVSLLTGEAPKTLDRRSYEDYVPSEPPDTTDESTEKLEIDVPDKFKGKSVADIIESYTQLESEYGRRNSEVGSLRKLTDQLLELGEKKTEETPAKKVDVDSLLDDPDAAINAAVDSNPRLKAIEDAMLVQGAQESKQAFESKHKDWQTTLRTTEFAEWVKGSPVRQQMLVHADANSDYEVATELFDNYALAKGNAISEATEQRDSTARKSVKKNVTEKGGSTSEKKVRKFKRSELIHMKLTDPNKYDAMKDEIFEAYANGNVI